jgi:CO dehydrogenase maturation factor
MTRVRVAFVGKGGTGKSTIAGTFARLLARDSGEPVLALDSDPLPGLPYALGVPVDDHPIPDDAVVEGPEGGPRWVLRADLSPTDVVERWAAEAPDGVRYLQFGNLWGHVRTIIRPQFAWSEVVRDLDPEAYHLVGDLPGGTRQPMAGWARYAEVVCVVVEPTAKSLLSGRRLLNLASAAWAPRHLLVVANRTAGVADTERIAARLERPVAATVPADPLVASADRRAAAPLDAAPDGPLVAAVAGLVETVRGLYPLDEVPERLNRRVIG